LRTLEARLTCGGKEFCDKRFMRQGRHFIPRVMPKGCGPTISHFRERVINDQGVFLLSYVPNQGAMFVLFHLIKCFFARCGVYFYRQIQAQRLVGCLSQHHQILALRTWLRVVGSQSPRLTVSFDLHRFYQLIRAPFHFVFSPCQRNFLSKFLMTVRTKLGATIDEK
jgi:hypothetical protein